LLAGAVLFTPSLAGATPLQGHARSDEMIANDIAAQVRQYRDPLFWNYAIQVNPPIHVVVKGGHVTLKGVVNSEVERRTAEAIARSTSGVFSVENELRLDRETRATR